MSSNTVVFEFNPSLLDYYGYVVWSELNSSTVIGGSAWGLNELKSISTFAPSGNPSFTLSPTLVNSLDPYWFIETAPGIYAPQKQTQTFFYLQTNIDTLGTTYVYNSKILDNALVSPYGSYTIWPTMRIFSLDWQLLQEVSVQRDSYSAFSLSLTNEQPAGTYTLQWGILIKGYPVNPFDVRNFGSMMVGDVQSTCYHEDTTILTRDAGYQPIKDLKVGDFIRIFKKDQEEKEDKEENEDNYKRIQYMVKGCFTNDTKKKNRNKGRTMYKMVATKTNGLTHDLMVTAFHSILLPILSPILSPITNARIIEGHVLQKAMDSPLFHPMQDQEVYHYYHLVLTDSKEEEEDKKDAKDDKKDAKEEDKQSNHFNHPLSTKQYAIYVNGGLLSESLSEWDYWERG